MRTIVLITLLFFFNSFQSANNSIQIRLTLITKGLVSPIGLVNAGDGSNRLFVIQQKGQVKIIKDGKLVSKPFLDIANKLDGLNLAYSEKGLLGLVFHPQYKLNGRFFVYYSAPSKNKDFDHISIVAEYNVSQKPDSADLKSEKIILAMPHPESNHNGGTMCFGSDGMLYIGTGDGGGAGDQHGSIGNGQDLNSLLGKILRININVPQNAEANYTIPLDNPFIRAGCKPEIWAYGLRNPWKFSFDKQTGRLFCADVGQNQYEEVNIIEKGKNYGWRLMEGYHCYNDPNCDKSNLTLPIDEYTHQTGISVIGGYIYRGKKIQSLNGFYIYGDWNGMLFALAQNPVKMWHRFDLIERGNNTNDIGSKINSFGEDEQGELYIVCQNLFGPKSPTGAIYKIEL